MLRFRARLAGRLILPLCLLSSFAWGEDVDKEIAGDVWAESRVEFPAFPEQVDLIPFSVGSRRDAKFLVDGRSITIGEDGVVRFTLVVIGSQGARNTSFEGLRCSTAERRYYASGRADKTWSHAPNDQWREIGRNGNSPYVELFYNYFCPGRSLMLRDADDARRVLRSGGVPKP